MDAGKLVLSVRTASLHYKSDTDALSCHALSK